MISNKFKFENAFHQESMIDTINVDIFCRRGIKTNKWCHFLKKEVKILSVLHDEILIKNVGMIEK